MAGAWAVYAWLRPAPEPYNPAVFTAFRQLEAACLAEDPLQQTQRCRRALEVMQACDARDPSCTADDYHDDLSRAGFDLPPLRTAHRP